MNGGPNFRKVLVLTFVVSLSSTMYADEAKISACIFQETFDAIADVGGNDGLWSSQGPIGDNLICDNVWTQTGKIDGGSQCLRLGVSNGYAMITTPDIDFSGTGKVVFRAGLWKTSNKKDVCLKASGASLSQSTVTLAETSRFYESEVTLSSGGGLLSLSFSTASSSNSSTSKNSYFFIDDILVYQDNPTDEQLQNAGRLILSGTFTDDAVRLLNDNLSLNDVITYIDATEAVFPEGAVLSPKNKNCLIAVSDNALANTENLIVDGVCAKLCLYEGAPFYAETDFEALDVSYDREFSGVGEAGYYSTICLPFSVDMALVPGVSALATLSAYDLQTGLLTFSRTTRIEANEPCLVAVKDSKPFYNLANVGAIVKASGSCGKNISPNTLTFSGYYHEMNEVTSTEKIWNLGFSNGQFVKVGDNVKVKPFRALLSIRAAAIPTTTSSSKGLAVEFIEPTRVETPGVSVDRPKMAYDLSGQPIRGFERNLTEYPAGKHLINGKIIVIKQTQP